MAREITDAEGVTWLCIKAFAGLGNERRRMPHALTTPIAFGSCALRTGAQDRFGLSYRRLGGGDRPAEDVLRHLLKSNWKPG